MPKESTHKNDKHFHITVSDRQDTRHYKIPKFISPFLVCVSLAITLVLLGSSIFIFSQHNRLLSIKSQTDSLEDAFVKLTSKNSNLHQSLNVERVNNEVISVVLTQIEEISGVNSSIDSDILDRLTTISDHLATKELDIDELYGRVDSLEESIGLESSQSISENTALMERIELAKLSLDQQKILHDSIPNGFPTENSGVTSAFGKREHPTTNQSSFHNGIDLKAVTGTKIFATADGIVKKVDANKLSGNRIVLSHNFGFQTRFAHLSEMSVKPGDVVQRGDLIGLSGNTGRSNGPHLHYEIRYLDKPHNPIDFVNWKFGNQEIFTNVRGIQWQSLISLISKQVSRPALQLSQVVL
jgi:murein DD-endopeptidase MepM/ murein hydrolase activator NlpD